MEMANGMANRDSRSAGIRDDATSPNESAIVDQPTPDKGQCNCENAQAEMLGAELIAGYTLELGENQLSTIKSKNLQAFVHQQQQKFEEAYPLYQDVWQFHHRQGETTSSGTISLLMPLTQVKHELEQREASFPRLQEVLDVITESSLRSTAGCLPDIIIVEQVNVMPLL